MSEFGVKAAALLALVTRSRVNHLGATRGHARGTDAGAGRVLVPKLRRFVTNEAIFGVFAAADARVLLVQKPRKRIATKPKLPIRVAAGAKSFKWVDHVEFGLWVCVVLCITAGQKKNE